MTMKDGKVYEKFIKCPHGSPDNPFTWGDECEKFLSLTEEIFSKQRGQKIIDMVGSLEELDDASELIELLGRDMEP